MGAALTVCWVAGAALGGLAAYAAYRLQRRDARRGVPATQPPTLQAALEVVRRYVEKDGSAVIYLHAGPEAPSFGVLLVGEKIPEGLPGAAKRLAEDALIKRGWNVYDHSHLDGEEES